MNKLNQHSNADEMVAGMLSVATRANGKKAISFSAAEQLVHDSLQATENTDKTSNQPHSIQETSQSEAQALRADTHHQLSLTEAKSYQRDHCSAATTESKQHQAFEIFQPPNHPPAQP